MTARMDEEVVGSLPPVDLEMLHATVEDIREHPDAGVKMASLIGIALVRPLTYEEMDQALDLIGQIRAGA